MGLRDIVKAVVAVADSVTADLQPNVSHYAWTGHDVTGRPTYASPVSRKAIVDRVNQWVRRPDGEMGMSQAYIAFLRPITANGASGRIEPIDPRDKFVLPDGSSWPIVKVSGFVDRGSSAPYFHEVWLG